METLANELGSDTLFCLYNKRSYIYGRGDKIQQISKNENLKFLLILPETKLLTKDVFQIYSTLDKQSYKGFIDKDLKYVLKNLKNDLALAAFELNKELKDLFKILKDNNLNVSLTGSGPALFIVNPTEEEIHKVKKLVDNKVRLEIVKEI